MINIRYFLITAMASAFSFAATQNTHAAVMTTGCVDGTSCTLQELIDGGTLSIGGVSFNNWSQDTNFTSEENGIVGVPGSVDLAGITVSGVDLVSTGNAGEYTLGLLYTSVNALSLPTTLADAIEAELELDIDFDVSTDSTAEITAAELILGNRSLGASDSFVELNFTDNGDINLQVLERTIPGLITDTDSHALAAAVNALSLETNIQTGMFTPGTVELFEYEMSFTVNIDRVSGPTGVPSPAIFSLMGLGLVAMGFRRRRFN